MAEILLLLDTSALTVYWGKSTVAGQKFDNKLTYVNVASVGGLASYDGATLKVTAPQFYLPSWSNSQSPHFLADNQPSFELV